MEKETKVILGTDIRQTDENRTWRCTVQTADKEIVTIPLEIVLKLFADYNIHIEKFGSHYRVKDVTK